MQSSERRLSDLSSPVHNCQLEPTAAGNAIEKGAYADLQQRHTIKQEKRMALEDLSPVRLEAGLAGLYEDM